MVTKVAIKVAIKVATNPTTSSHRVKSSRWGFLRASILMTTNIAVWHLTGSVRRSSSVNDDAMRIVFIMVV
jgi:hypothetical protein